MSFSQTLDALDRDAMLGGRCSTMIPWNCKDPEEAISRGLNLQGSNTTPRNSSDARYAPMLAYEDLLESGALDTDMPIQRLVRPYLGRYASSSDANTTNHAFSGVIFGREEIEQNGECLKPVLDKRSLDSKDGEIPDPDVDVAPGMTDGDEVRQALIRRAREYPSFRKHLAELGEEVEALRTAAEWNQQQLLNIGKAKSADGHDLRKAPPRRNRFVRALGKLFKKLGRVGIQAINVVHKKIVACFNVARSTTGKVFRVIRTGLFWIVRAIIDPQGEIRAILDDPEKSTSMKVIEVIGVIAVAAVGALIMSFATAGTGPYGAGATTVGVAIASGAIRR